MIYLCAALIFAHCLLVVAMFRSGRRTLAIEKELRATADVTRTLARRITLVECGIREAMDAREAVSNMGVHVGQLQARLPFLRHIADGDAQKLYRETMELAREMIRKEKR